MEGFSSKQISRESFLISGSLHLFFLALIGLILYRDWSPKNSETVEFDVMDAPTAVKAAPGTQAILANPVALTKPKAQQKVQENARKVFGVSKNSVLDDSSTVAVKAGNTVAKTMDNLKLRPEDEAALPIPVDQFLVTQMPKLTKEIRASYPAEAKERRIEGTVLAELLIDSAGKVRAVRILQDPGFGLAAAAEQALRAYEFVPAQVGDKSVPVKIRYRYKFELETL